MTMALPESHPLETSGSLTGHILAQGRADATPAPRNSAKVWITLGVGFAILVGVGVLVVLLVGDAFSTMFDGLID